MLGSVGRTLRSLFSVYFIFFLFFLFIIIFTIFAFLIMISPLLARAGRAIVKGKPRAGCACLLIWIMVGQGLSVFIVGASWGCLDIFFSAISSLFFLPLSEMDG